MMKKDYFKEAKAIMDTVLDNMSKKNELDDSQYYTIDILNVDDLSAKVKVCDKYQYLAKEQGNWVVVSDPEAVRPIA
ncbi:MAG: hypothetical protein ACI32F_00105 [Allobaculum sp.]